jgi:hypothetical protein
MRRWLTKAEAAAEEEAIRQEIAMDTMDDKLTAAAQLVSTPHLAGAGTITAPADGYDLLAVRIRRGTVIDGAIVALCPDADGVVTADVCIDGPPRP